MIPQIPEDTQIQELEYDTYGTKTYRFDMANKRIIGMTDGLEAYKISAEKALKTSRYAHSIYDGNYGSFLHKYIGQDFDYVKAGLPREIIETLSQDDRFQAIEDFIIQQTGLDHCIIKFNIRSTEGVVPMELEV